MKQLLRLPQVRDRVGLSRSEIYRRVSIGEFPAPVALGARAVAWDADEIQQWVKQRIASRANDRSQAKAAPTAMTFGIHKPMSTKGLLEREPVLLQYPPQLRLLYRTHLHSASAAGRRSTLTPTQFADLVTSPCHYCGGEPAPYNGVDRVDNTLGYVARNVVSCCRLCNRMKSDLSLEVFMERVHRIALRLGRVV